MEEKKKAEPSINFLLTLKGNLRDSSNRLFENITALQYAAWARNIGMMGVILKFLPKAEAVHQLDELISSGIKYKVYNEENKITETWCGYCYDYMLLIRAYEKYLAYLEENPDPDLDIVNRMLINEIGKAQFMVPMGMVDIFCHGDLVDHWGRGSLKKELLNQSHYDAPKCSGGIEPSASWFQSPGLGTEWAIVRGSGLTQDYFTPQPNARMAKIIRSVDELKDMKQDVRLDYLSLSCLLATSQDQFRFIIKRLKGDMSVNEEESLTLSGLIKHPGFSSVFNLKPQSEAKSCLIM